MQVSTNYTQYEIHTISFKRKIKIFSLSENVLLTKNYGRILAALFLSIRVMWHNQVMIERILFPLISPHKKYKTSYKLESLVLTAKVTTLENVK